MSHLAKAKAALDAAKKVTDQIHDLDDEDDKTRRRLQGQQIELLDIARTQATVDIAESLRELARRPRSGASGLVA